MTILGAGMDILCINAYMCLDKCLGVIYSFRQETLATAMQKIMCVLGSFTSDTEVKVCFAILYTIEDLVLLLHVAVLSDFITSFYLIHD